MKTWCARRLGQLFRATCLLLGLLNTPAVMSQNAPSTSATQVATASAPADPYLWLEEVQGERALQWVRE